jgi:hypothetical protein
VADIKLAANRLQRITVLVQRLHLSEFLFRKDMSWMHVTPKVWITRGFNPV